MTLILTVTTITNFNMYNIITMTSKHSCDLILEHSLYRTTSIHTNLHLEDIILVHGDNTNLQWQPGSHSPTSRLHTYTHRDACTRTHHTHTHTHTHKSMYIIHTPQPD